MSINNALTFLYVAADSKTLVINSNAKSFSVKSLISKKENIEYIISKTACKLFTRQHNHFRQFD